MMKKTTLLYMLLASAAMQAQTGRITVDTGTRGHDIPQSMYGIFFEEINHAGDGGLYAEMVQNRGFEEHVLPTGATYRDGKAWAPHLPSYTDLTYKDLSIDWDMEAKKYLGWKIAGRGCTFTKDVAAPETPLDAATPNALRLKIDKSRGGNVTVSNTGYWGMHFADGAAYRLRFYMKPSGYKGKLTVRLTDGDGNIYAEKDIKVDGKARWTEYAAELTAKGTTVAGELQLELTGSGSVDIDYVSLFPADTYKGRANGMRRDIAETLPAQTERMYLTVADSNFKKGSSNANVADKENNAFTIQQSFGSVWWSWTAGKDFSDYQMLVLRIKAVEGNTVRLLIKDKNNGEYQHRVDIAKISGRQEIIVDLMPGLKRADGKGMIDLKRINRIEFWNYWDDGDGNEAATVTLDEMFFEPYGGATHIGNPVVQTLYTSDPAPMVSGDRLYLYTGHDEFGATNYEMNDWRVYSTADMVNWTDHGSPLDYSVFKWSTGSAWASQCIERDGKFYWYTNNEYRRDKTNHIGVVVGDTPLGQFHDPVGKPLTGQWADIDPSVFVDNDGQAYMYYGNNVCRYALLGDDMISLKGAPKEIELTAEAFGGVKVDGVVTGDDCFEEAPWIYRRGDIYYLVYAAGGIPEHISYSTASSPTGPWTYRGVIMPAQGGSFTNHPGIIDFKGHSYFVYHNGALEGGGGFTRSVAIEEFSYNVDGTFPSINMTSSGVAPIGTLNPFERVEDETIAWSYGVRTTQEDGTIYVDSIDGGDYIKVRVADFAEGAKSMTVRARGVNGGRISVYADNPRSEPLAVFDVPADSYWADLQTALTSSPTGVHDIYFVFSATGSETSKLLKFDSWQFSVDPTAIDAVTVSPDGGKDASRDGGIYDISGRKIHSQTAAPSGIYIRNGKKYVK